MELGVFEHLFAGSDVPVADHEDLSDRDQTLNVPGIKEPPVDTGVKDHIRVLIGIMVTSGAGLICILRRRKKH